MGVRAGTNGTPAHTAVRHTAGRHTHSGPGNGIAATHILCRHGAAVHRDGGGSQGGCHTNQRHGPEHFGVSCNCHPETAGVRA